MIVVPSPTGRGVTLRASAAMLPLIYRLAHARAYGGVRQHHGSMAAADHGRGCSSRSVVNVGRRHGLVCISDDLADTLPAHPQEAGNLAVQPTCPDGIKDGFGLFGVETCPGFRDALEAFAGRCLRVRRGSGRHILNDSGTD